MKGCDLFKMYASFVRPILEANSVIFHSMLTRTQCHEIEMMQKRALRLCFGFELTYAEIYEKFSIRTLEHRREQAVQKFVKKDSEKP